MIVLDDPDTWPGELWELLRDPELVEHLREADFIEELDGLPSLTKACNVAERVMEEVGVAGFHFTRAVDPGRLASGLRVLDMEAHQAEMLEILAPQLGPELTERARQRMAAFAASDQRQIRQGQLWFCFARSTVNDFGIENLVRFFGGEAVFWWLKQDPDLAAVPERVGEPVVVEAKLSPAEMRPGTGQRDLGKSLVSHFGSRCVDENLNTWDVDTFVTAPIPADRIVAVQQLDEFRKRWG